MHSSDFDIGSSVYAPASKVDVKNRILLCLITPPYVFACRQSEIKRTMKEATVGGDARTVIRHHADRLTKQRWKSELNTR